ncbi:anthranilate synthase component I [Dorcoceras hygrometricum]|uniref:Anthranilate synthase component I n=1 Tax=Dorcoceras hygrometricum TaxID=472368 RepID=A0A2Z7A407_9LAMI|nr:anthranilate synthase component I [Dorcoceras hygrometricum]
MAVDDDAGTSTYHDWDHYITSVTEEDIAWGSTVATRSGFQEYHGEYTTFGTNVQEPDDLFGDSAQNVTYSEHSTEGSDSDENVDEMRTTTSNEPTGSHMPYDPIMREIPQFMNTVFDEQVPDSYGLPSGGRTSFYDPGRPKLCTKMVFKTKKELIAAVKITSMVMPRSPGPTPRVSDSPTMTTTPLLFISLGWIFNNMCDWLIITCIHVMNWTLRVFSIGDSRRVK